MNDILKILETMNFSKEELEVAKLTLDTVSKIADEIEPYAAKFDEIGVKKENGEVIVPEGMMDFYKKLADMGLLGLFIPEEYGGSGMPYTFYAAMVEIISRACPCIGVGLAVHGTAIDSILDYGTEEAKKKYLPKMAKGELLGAICFTEAGSGSDIGAAKTTAVLDGDNYIVNGNKIFITQGGIADLYTVLAVTDKEAGKKGLSAFIIQKSAEGFSVGKVEEKMGLHGSPTTEIIFNDCKVPKEDLLGVEGKGLSYVLKGLTGGRIEIAAQATGIANAAYKKAIAYAKERKQFEKSIGEFQAVQFKLADMLMNINASRRMYLSAALLKDKKMPHIMEASAAKLFASEAALRVCEEAIQVYGGYGYTTEFGLERHYRDARVTTIYEGTSEIQRLILAREALG